MFYTLAETIFRGTLANFCKSKKCIIFKLKFDMTLIGHSPFKTNMNI